MISVPLHIRAIREGRLLLTVHVHLKRTSDLNDMVERLLGVVRDELAVDARDAYKQLGEEQT